MPILLRVLLVPFSFFYIFIVIIRNKLFDLNIFKSKKYDIPIIGVGNLSVGGTGKTPHTEYIINQLSKENALVAVLSRGYKRKTKGFIVVSHEHINIDVGDEAIQYRKKFNENIIVAVDSNRARGIENLIKLYPDLKAIVLDDCFQHRWVKPGLNILLTDFFNPFYKDHIFPFGSLRETKSGYKRADIIVVTKCEFEQNPILKKEIIHNINPLEHQKVFFSKISYATKKNIFDEEFNEIKKHYSFILLFTGIANSYPLEQYLKSRCSRINSIKFNDHYSFTKKDILKLIDIFESDVSTSKAIFTTEKDISRLKNTEMLELLKKYPVYYVPIEVVPLKNDIKNFNKIIEDYVRKNQKNN